ncbi:hypothetical protein KC19_11G011500 [Ceratodon purpureus]|uniref:Uncharacterized protein n=1 Tax=Ceratodon purpureus TaxID=3225 RepID=A0A8T0GB25_CERPU|nr:hypothetical protein KC19_11G011500 [Ceratodon purpureus]
MILSYNVFLKRRMMLTLAELLPDLQTCSGGFGCGLVRLCIRQSSCSHCIWCALNFQVSSNLVGISLSLSVGGSFVPPSHDASCHCNLEHHHHHHHHHRSDIHTSSGLYTFMAPFQWE